MGAYFPKLPAGPALTFDDVLLDPQPADFTRNETDITTTLSPTLHLKLPVVSSPMDRVTEEDMAIAIAQNGGLGIIHRNLAVRVQAAMIELLKAMRPEEGASLDDNRRLLVGAAVGPGTDLQERADALYDAGADVLLVDAAHGASKPVLDAIRFLKGRYPNKPVIGGSVANQKGARAVIAAGADILRVGLGAGSICTTRVMTGIGVPQLTAIDQAALAALDESEKQGRQVTIIADGGMRQIGDMMKALACRAHAVMLGSLLAGFDESPGAIVSIGGKQYKEYRGMGSASAMKEGSANRYGQSTDTNTKHLIAEGVEALVPLKGPVAEFLLQVRGGIKQGLFYSGSRTIDELHHKEGDGPGQSIFLQISPASVQESHPHSVMVTNAGRSYVGNGDEGEKG